MRTDRTPRQARAKSHLIDAHPAWRSLRMVLRQDHAAVRLQAVLDEQRLEFVGVLLHLAGARGPLECITVHMCGCV